MGFKIKHLFISFLFYFVSFIHTSSSTGLFHHHHHSSTAQHSTQPLNDQSLLKILARCSYDAYEMNGKFDVYDWVKVLEVYDESSGNEVGAVLYEIIQGDHTNKTILTFRGSWSVKDWLTDATLIERADFMPYVTFAREILCNSGADYVTGHSLGAITAEAAASWVGVEGAAFNGPGPKSSQQSKNLAGDAYDGVKFEVHLTRGDLISPFGESLEDADETHIGTPIWHNIHFPLDAHSMRGMLLNLGC
mmetsp:Transcript_28531/g.37328  ORF Transcript_28531/g.37328 Transcript_28531/m.37328 type:complete len:248 (+) Transcript_28531:56-799(+)